jgi:aminopeptidase N
MKLLCLSMFILFSGIVFAANNDDNLTFKLASLRKSQIKSLSYDLQFELQKKAAGFTGKTLITVELHKLDAPLTLDLVNNKISSLKVNGEIVKKFQTTYSSFEIPTKYLKEKTEIEILYTGSYSKNAGGLIRAFDPEDNAEYIYTDFEPNHAHSVFPSFDQPDLKANFHVTIKAPQDWKVIQNELIDSAKTEGEFTTTTFKKTPLISTYLFFVGAGDFVEWKDEYKDIPLYLYARKSLQKYVDADVIFKTTKAGLKFFNDYFDYDYPFSKYGQVFVPEFAWGGMENPGAVTLNERNIFRGPVSISLSEKRDNLILHEMAHMWFGDLVTMQWWNDLWLNESFATYLASIAQDRAMKGDGTWMAFFTTKTWGYWQDQLVTTHPIETDVPDVRTAKGNFDGITYAKGASALKQLHFFVGDKGFRNGLRHYFKTYAFKNTERKDFINAIGEASKTDLTAWTKAWLQTAGPNHVSTEFTCEDGRVKTFTIHQTANASKAFSPHRMRIGLYREKDFHLKDSRIAEVMYEGENTLAKELVGDECPAFVLPNVDDQDYALFTLDPLSLKRTELALKTLENPLSRIMIWHTLSEMVRNQKIRPKEFIEMAIAGLEAEENDLLLGNILGRHSTLRDQYFLYLNSNERSDLAKKMEEVLIKRVLAVKGSTSLQMNFFDFYVSVAQTQNSQVKLSGYLNGKDIPKGITIDQDRRWMIISTLATNGYAGVEKVIEEELKRDASTMGKRMAYAARAAIPNLKAKEIYWKDFFGKEKLSFSNFKEAAMRFNGPNQESLSNKFANDFFAKVTTLDWKQHDDDVEIYFEEIFPVQLCNGNILSLSEKSFKRAKNLTALARRSWMEAQDELSRCVKVRTQDLKISKGL